jgi:cystathionine beta-lyase
VKVAHWLKDQQQVSRILHPAFAECAGHEYWKRDFTGSSGLFTFALKGGDKAARDRLVDSLELFGIGYSWGGFESLAIPADTDNLRTVAQRDHGGPLVRLHIGLEDPDDLIADLAQALSSYPAS